MCLVNPSSLNYFYSEDKPKYLRKGDNVEEKERIKARFISTSYCHEQDGKGWAALTQGALEPMFQMAG